MGRPAQGRPALNSSPPLNLQPVKQNVCRICRTLYTLVWADTAVTALVPSVIQGRPAPRGVVAACNGSAVMLGHCSQGVQQYKPIYTLTAIIKHHSRTIASGHYTARCRSALNKTWYECNDSSRSDKCVGPADSAYVFTYRLQD